EGSPRPLLHRELVDLPRPLHPVHDSVLAHREERERLLMAIAAEAVAGDIGRPGAAYLQARLAKFLDWLVAFWIFSGGFVLTEPSPYELSFLAVLGIAVFAGLGIHRSTLGLMVLFAGFIPFAFIAAFQVKNGDLMDALIFQAVTVFLLFTGYFIANYVADAPQQRMRLVIGAYIGTAV